MLQTDKKFCPSRSVSQEPYIIWLSFMGKNDISRFFSILKFWFSMLWGGLKGQKWPKTTKISVCRTLYIRDYISHDLHLWYTCMYKRIISPGVFFHFFPKCWFLGSLAGFELAVCNLQFAKRFYQFTNILTSKYTQLLF